MAQDSLAKVPQATKVADIRTHLELSPEVLPLVREGQTPRQFLDLLREKEEYRTAIKFLAFALPKREAVWWCCLCVEDVFGADLDPKGLAALKAAVRWVLDPSEDNRRAAQAPGEEAGMGTPAGLAATAAFWSGGSLLAANLPCVEPTPEMTPKAVAGGIDLASVECEAAKILDLQRRLLDLGIGVAEGKFTWPAIKPKPDA